MPGILNPFRFAAPEAPPPSGVQPSFSFDSGTIPSTVAVGDQLLMFVYSGSRNNGDPGAPTATGWVSVGHWAGAGFSGDYFSLTVFKRTAQAGDAGATVTPSYPAGTGGPMVAINGYSGIASIGTPTQTMNSPTSVTTTTTADNERLVYFIGAWRFNGGPVLTIADPVGVTNRTTGDVASTHQAARVSDEVQASAGATTARTWAPLPGTGGAEIFGVVTIPLVPA